MEKLHSDIKSVRILICLLVQKGIKEIVLSPGSRNAPLLVSVAREKRLKHHVIVDERSAAFFALGIAQQTGQTVALICTSGTALLNYSPAVAEAYYQGIPLLVISADRPSEWIDQDDSQTIQQQGALCNFVKAPDSHHVQRGSLAYQSSGKRGHQSIPTRPERPRAYQCSPERTLVRLST